MMACILRRTDNASLRFCFDCCRPHARCRLLSSAAIVGLSLLLIAATTAAAKPCLTKEQARKLWPSEWLYWHTERHCWDRIKGTSGTYDERQPEPPPSTQQQAADVIPAALPKQVTTTKEKKLPEPEILYPAVLMNKSNILETVPLTVKQPWLSPHSILGWPLLIDVDRPAFREWEKRIGNE